MVTVAPQTPRREPGVTDVRPNQPLPPPMPARHRLLFARLAGGAGVALAVAGGVLLYSRVPLAFGLPVALLVTLLAGVVLMVYAAGRERREADRRQAALLDELRQAHARLAEQRDQARA